MLNRRRSPRLPVIKNFAKEVHISIGKELITGVILNLSANGMLLLTYSNMPSETNLLLTFNLLDIQTKQIEGKIVRSTKKSIMYEVAIEFVKIDTLDSKRINRMAIDYNDCENKINLGAVDVCRQECSCFEFCERENKIKKK